MLLQRGCGYLRRGLLKAAVHEVLGEGRAGELPLPEGLPEAFRTHHEEEQVGSSPFSWEDHTQVSSSLSHSHHSSELEPL